jgi:acetyltransferase-like isoleucine patch superfamily enzyme
VRILAYTWLSFVQWLTAGLPDFTPILKLRGAIVRSCFRSCGRNFQLAGGVRILFSTRIDIGNDVYIAPGCWLQGVGGITLGDEVMLGPYTVLATNNHTKRDGSYRFGPGSAAPISLGRGAWTGAHAVVTAGCMIGAGAAVAAGAVVTQNVPDHAVAGGVPARVLTEMSNGE